MPVRAETCICVVWQQQELGMHLAENRACLGPQNPAGRAFLVERHAVAYPADKPQTKDCIVMLQAEGRKWRQRTYARDNGAIARRRDSGNSANGLSSPAGTNPATPIRLPKFAQQKQGKISWDTRVTMHC